MVLADKHNEGLIFEKRTGATVNNLLPDDKTNVERLSLAGNITSVEWDAETEIKYPATQIPQINNNQYAALAGEWNSENNGN